MKLLLVLLISISCFALNTEQIQNKVFVNAPTAASLITVAVACSTAWVNLGTAKVLEGSKSIGLFIDRTINDSENMRIQALTTHSAGGSNYYMPTEVVASTEVKITPKYYELDTDATNKQSLYFDTNGSIYSVLFQISCGTVGTTAATIDAASYTMGWK